jgi:hypothetical protein
VLRKGDEIEIRPGIISRDAEGAVRCSPILSRVLSLFAEKNDLEYAVPGGLIGVGTLMDPTLTRADRLVGQVGLSFCGTRVLDTDTSGPTQRTILLFFCRFSVTRVSSLMCSLRSKSPFTC